MRLKTRIIIALATIAAVTAIHATAYLVPRLWHERARLYPGAYEKAVRILKEEFGDAAVARGVITIPRGRVVAPYRGTVDVSLMTVVLSPPGESSWVVARHFDAVLPYCTVGRISREKAKGIWVTLSYLGSAEVAGTPPVVPATFDLRAFEPAVFSDRSFQGVARDRRGCEKVSVANGSIEAAVRGLLQRRLSEDGVAHEGVVTSRNERDLCEGLKALIEQCLPPRGPADGQCVEVPLEDYTFTQGRGALGYLRAVSKYMSDRPSPFAALQRLPWVGGAIRRWQTARKQSHRRLTTYYPVDDLIRFVEVSDGKDKSELRDTLVDAAFANSATPGSEDWERMTDAQRAGAYRKNFARSVLRTKWPDKWPYLMLLYSGRLSRESKTANPSHKRDTLSPDDFFLAMLALDEDDNVKGEASDTPDRLTRDPQYVRLLKETAEKRARRGSGTAVRADASVWLGSVYSKGYDVGDIDAYIRRVLRRDDLAREKWRACYLINAVGGTSASGLVPLLAGIVNEPEKVFRDDLPADTRLEIREAAAGALTRIGDASAVDAAIRFLSRPITYQEDLIVYMLVNGLGDAGEKRALTILGGLRTTGPPPPRGLTLEPRQWDTDDECVRTAIIKITIKNTPNRAECFASMSARDRRLMTVSDLTRLFTRDELVTLLADPRCQGERAEILSAFLLQRQAEMTR